MTIFPYCVVFVITITIYVGMCAGVMMSRMSARLSNPTFVVNNPLSLA